MYKFAILIPSYNEYPSLKKIIKKLNRSNSILIMDDCSNDGTNLLKNQFKKVLIHNNKHRLGYERNLLKGFRILIKKKFSHIITFDADGEHHTSNINKVKKFLKTNRNVDLLVGNRSQLNRFSEKLVSTLFKFRYDIEDPLSGLKVYKISALKKNVNSIKKNFLVDLLYKFIKEKRNIKNLRIKSIKIKNRKSKVGSFILSNFKIIKCLKYLI